MRRRTFFGTAFTGLGSAATAKPARAKAGDIPVRTLGSTGVQLTCVGMGGARFHMVPMEEGIAVVRRAYDLGINYFDVARAYGGGLGEQVYGNAIPPPGRTFSHQQERQTHGPGGCRLICALTVAAGSRSGSGRPHLNGTM